MSELAEKLIAENLKTKNPYLDLGCCGLDGTEEELYKPLRDAGHLKTLIFSNTWREHIGWDRVLHESSNNNNTRNEFYNLPNSIPETLEELFIGGEFELQDIWRIEDIEGLKYLKRLKILHLASNEIQDIEPLKKLQNLQFLDLNQNLIQNIDPLKDLNNLSKIDAYSNKIQDIEPLKKLNNLVYLFLRRNKIQDITPLRELNNLQYLHFSDNQVQDITPLRELKNLQYLYLEYNKIQDITPLRELEKLTEIYCRGNKIQDILFLKNFKNTRIHIHPLRYLKHPPPIWYIYLNRKGDTKIGDHTHLPEPPHVEKIWQLLKSKDEKNIALAHQLALSQGWTEEEFEMYKKLL